DFIAHAPIFVLATSDGSGRVDVSPKGGPAGFVSVLDDHHLAFADMAGNNRLDSLQNVVACDAVSLLFFVPGVGETLRVVGKASVSTTPEVLERCSLGQMAARIAVVVEVTTAYLHCAKALKRSGLWEPDRWPEIADMAPPAQMLRDHTGTPRATEEVQRALDESYATATWAMGGIAGG
ncbi:MAG: MSMEG_1061 family FMN-dependent PPOX-type flavoprotein, partial [Acidimicrobiales bacterium]